MVQESEILEERTAENQSYFIFSNIQFLKHPISQTSNFSNIQSCSHPLPSSSALRDQVLLTDSLPNRLLD